MRRFDLIQYSIANFVQDVDDIRRALGYDRINVSGGSYGTYAALAYMRAHPKNVRTAALYSLVDVSNRIPLYHAKSAQYALDQLFAACAANPDCHAAYPHLADDFKAVLAKVHAGPVRTWAPRPPTGQHVEISLTEASFADAVRVMMYSGKAAHQLPLLIEHAKAGDFSPFAEAALRSNRGLYEGIRMGLNYAVTCNEFTNRIRPEEIAAATRGSYFGDWRVRGQMAICAQWPKAPASPASSSPYRLNIPTLLVSGDMDPVAPAYWADRVKAHLPESVHIIVPGGHTPANACTDAIQAELERTGSIRSLDIRCVAKLAQPPFVFKTEAVRGD